MHARSLCVQFLFVFALGCDSDPTPKQTGDARVSDAGAADATADGAIDAGTMSLCANVEPGGVGVASASFGVGRLKFEPLAALSGSAAAAIVESKNQGFGGLIAYPGGLIALGWTGFWDIESNGSHPWVETSTYVTGAVVGDIDGDGDQDAVILSSRVEGSDGLVSRVLTWERTDSGLVERTLVRKSSPVLAMPFLLHDVDDDGHLDLLTYESGAAVGYIGDGAFGFMRKQLGEALSDFTEPEPLAVALADRDGDGVQDLLCFLAVASEATGVTVIEQSIAVLPGDGQGGFKPAIVTPKVETTASAVGIADVTGDGLDDIVTPQFDGEPRLHLTRSVDAFGFAEPVDVPPGGTGIQFADANGDGTRDIITVNEGRLIAIVAREDGSYAQRDLGNIEPEAKLLAFTGEQASADAPALLHVLYQCPAAEEMP